MKASNCKHETSNGRCGLKGCYAYRHKCFTEDLCKCHEPMTNADRMNAMSIEEKAAFIVDEVLDIKHEEMREIAYGAWLKWLQQPCGGADHA